MKWFITKKSSVNKKLNKKAEDLGNPEYSGEGFAIYPKPNYGKFKQMLAKTIYRYGTLFGISEYSEDLYKNWYLQYEYILLFKNRIIGLIRDRKGFTFLFPLTFENRRIGTKFLSKDLDNLKNMLRIKNIMFDDYSFEELDENSFLKIRETILSGLKKKSPLYRINGYIEDIIGTQYDDYMAVYFYLFFYFNNDEDIIEAIKNNLDTFSPLELSWITKFIFKKPYENLDFLNEEKKESIKRKMLTNFPASIDYLVNVSAELDERFDDYKKYIYDTKNWSRFSTLDSCLYGVIIKKTQLPSEMDKEFALKNSWNSFYYLLYKGFDDDRIARKITSSKQANTLVLKYQFDVPEEILNAADLSINELSKINEIPLEIFYKKMSESESFKKMVYELADYYFKTRGSSYKEIALLDTKIQHSNPDFYKNEYRDLKKGFIMPLIESKNYESLPYFYVSKEEIDSLDISPEEKQKIIPYIITKEDKKYPSEDSTQETQNQEQINDTDDEKPRNEYPNPYQKNTQPLQGNDYAKPNQQPMQPTSPTKQPIEQGANNSTLSYTDEEIKQLFNLKTDEEILNMKNYIIKLKKENPLMTEDEVIEKILKIKEGKFNPKGKRFLSKKKSNFPSNPLKKVGDTGLTEKEVWEYYDKMKYKIFPYLKGHNVLLKIFTDDGVIIKRKDSDGKYLQINTIEDYDRWNGGRQEFHITLNSEESDIAWIDIDPKIDKSVDIKKIKNDCKELIKKILKNMHKMSKNDKSIFSKLLNIQVFYSGGRGYHIFLKFNKKMNIKTIKNVLKKCFENNIIPHFNNVKLDITKPGEIRLDLTTFHNLGSIRAPYSYNLSTGKKSKLLFKKNIV